MVEVGLTEVDPLDKVEVKLPGEIAMVVAPLVDQLNVALVPEFTVVGLAVKEEIVGAEPLPEPGELPTPAQLPRHTETRNRKPAAKRLRGGRCVRRK